MMPMLLGFLVFASTAMKAGARVTWQSCRHEGGFTTPFAPAWRNQTSSLADCKKLCVTQESCQGIFYRPAKDQCALSATRPQPVEGVHCLRQLEVTGPGVFVMLPLDVVTQDGHLKDAAGLAGMLDKLVTAGVEGFMVDVWWGITEPRPGVYQFSAYRELVNMAKARGFQILFITSFHQCGGNVGDACDIPLPAFVRQVDGIWYRDGDGDDVREYISLFADSVKVAGGRTPLDMYSGWFSAFAKEFEEDLGNTIAEINVGMGPSGELRYPSYRLAKWHFCGIGAFQAYDQHALASLEAAARAAGHSLEWGLPPNASSVGSYNSRVPQTDFFTRGFKTDYGKFFLDWYSSSLKAHGAAVLSRARQVFGDRVHLAGKISGVHWWYGDTSHAAEATAGYYNTNFRNAYAEIADIFKAVGATLDFTCMEMRNSGQPARCFSRPEDLVGQVLQAGREKGVHVNGENALLRFDEWAYSKILSYREDLQAFTYLRLGSGLLETNNFERFKSFVDRMHGGRRLQGEDLLV